MLKQRSVLVAAAAIAALLVATGLWLLLVIPVLPLILLAAIHQAPT
jgi:hypothetical protein